MKKFFTQGQEKSYKKFLKKTEQPEARFKALRNYIKEITVNVEKLKDFYENEYTTIFTVCYLRLYAFDTHKPKGSATNTFSHFHEIEAVFNILYDLFKNFPEGRLPNFEKKNFILIVSKGLRHRNRDEIRSKAFVLLVLYFNSYQNAHLKLEDDVKYRFMHCVLILKRNC